MRTCLGFLLVALSACAARAAPPMTTTGTSGRALPNAPSSDVLPPAAPAGPVVVIDSEHITIEGKFVGSVPVIDRSGRLQRIDELWEILKDRRAAWKAAHDGEAFAGIASLVVAPGTSGRVFTSVYQTMAFAGFPKIHVALGGRYWETSAQVPGPPCGSPGGQCGVAGRHTLHVQVDPSSWRLRVPREGSPLDASGEGPRATVEAFHAAASDLVSSAGIDGVMVHVAPDVPFSRLAPFLADAVELGRRAALAGGVTVAAYGIDTVRGVLTAGSDGSTPSGRLPPELIQKVVRAHFTEFRKCYENALAHDPKATGKTVTRFVIDRNGAVREAHTTLSGTLPPEMSTCMEAEFRSLTFEAPSENSLTVNYPILFNPGE
jgi:hypothetical protein